MSAPATTEAKPAAPPAPAAPPPPSDKIKIKVDGREVEVPKMMPEIEDAWKATTERWHDNLKRGTTKARGTGMAGRKARRSGT